jgi:hypothetical protein
MLSAFTVLRRSWLPHRAARSRGFVGIARPGVKLMRALLAVWL